MTSTGGKTSDFDDEDVVIRQFKIILLGDGAVGKTSIANRFTDDKFSQNYKQTVFLTFCYFKSCQLKFIDRLEWTSS